MKVDRCPGCLTPGNDTYCKKCRTVLFGGRRIHHILNFSRPEFNSYKREVSSNRLSLSGIQVKHSLRIENKELILTEEKGEYILKPVPSGDKFERLNQLPANEHLTMQAARNIFKIRTAENGIIFFRDDEPAYITKRFDVKDDGSRILQEDFAQLAGRTEETGGKNYKYDFSYEESAELMKKYIKAYQVEAEKYFSAVLFNYLFSNGDAHLKNFSVQRNNEFGDYLLTPFYDLLNSSIHVPGENDTALELFKGGYQTESYKYGSKYTKDDFAELAKRIGIKESRFNKLYNNFLIHSEEVEELVNKSFLSEEAKKIYLEGYYRKLERLK